MPPPKRKSKGTDASDTAKTKKKKKKTTKATETTKKQGNSPSPLNVPAPHPPSIYGYHELAQGHHLPEETENPLSTAQTFAEALRVTDAVRDAVRRLLPRLPRRGAAIYRPTTLSEATSYVNAREDAKKKQGVARLDGDVVAVPAERYRAAHPGVAEGDGEAAAFWLYTSDFFRDFCVEDAAELLGFLKGAEELDAFRLPELRARAPSGLPVGERSRGSEGSGEPRQRGGGLLDEPIIQPQRRQRRYVGVLTTYGCMLLNVWSSMIRCRSLPPFHSYVVHMIPHTNPSPTNRPTNQQGQSEEPARCRVCVFHAVPVGSGGGRCPGQGAFPERKRACGSRSGTCCCFVLFLPDCLFLPRWSNTE